MPPFLIEHIPKSSVMFNLTEIHFLVGKQRGLSLQSDTEHPHPVTVNLTWAEEESCAFLVGRVGNELVLKGKICQHTYAESNFLSPQTVQMLVEEIEDDNANDETGGGHKRDEDVESDDDDDDCGEFIVVNLSFLSSIEAQIFKDAYSQLYLKYMQILVAHWRCTITADS